MKRTQVLKIAEHLINHDRHEEYGDALVMHTRIAQLWSAVLGKTITPEQVALCMACLKIARLTHSPKHKDSWVDAIAYLALGGEFSTDD